MTIDSLSRRTNPWGPVTPIERLLFDWKLLFFDRVNTAMGKNPLYPFDISKPVADKLGFVHIVVRHTADRYSTQ